MARQIANEKAVARIHVKCLEREKSKLQALANTYAGGNLTAWILYAAFNVPRKHITLNDLHAK